MNKRILAFLILMIAMLCVPTAGQAKMTVLTENELVRVTAQKGIAVLPGSPAPATAVELLSTGMADVCGASGFYHLASTGLLPWDMPIAVDVRLAGEDATAMALHGLTMAAGVVSLVNPLFGGFSGLGLVPGAFEVEVGDVEIQMSGTIAISFHP